MAVAPPAGKPPARGAATPRAPVGPVLVGVAVLAGCTAAGIGALSLTGLIHSHDFLHRDGGRGPPCRGSRR